MHTAETGRTHPQKLACVQLARCLPTGLDVSHISSLQELAACRIAEHC